MSLLDWLGVAAILFAIGLLIKFGYRDEGTAYDDMQCLGVGIGCLLIVIVVGLTIAFSLELVGVI